MRRSKKRGHSPSLQTRKRFLAGFEKLEDRNLLAGLTVVVEDAVATAAEIEPAKIKVTLDPPFSTYFFHAGSYLVGGTAGVDDYYEFYDPPFNPSGFGSYFSTVTEWEIEVWAYSWDVYTDDPVESVVIRIYANDGVTQYTYDATVYIYSDPPTSPDEVLISDPPCQCSASSSGSRSDSNPQNGNNIVMPPVGINGLGDYMPRYSTSPFRPLVYTADVPFRSRTLEPDIIDVNGTPFDATGVSSGEVFRIGDVLDPTLLPPGRHEWELEVVEHYPSDPDFTYPIRGHALVGGGSNALMSPGWSIPGIDRLTVTADGALWQSNGDQLIWFTENGGVYTTPDGDQDGSTLTDNLDGTFTLSNRWGDQQTFNALGFVTEKVDRRGRTTTFTYTDADSDLDSDDILEIETYDGRTLTYAYTSDRISSITDFDGREVFFTYDGDDQLETIEFPDPDDAGPLDALVTAYTYVTGTSYLETADDNGKITEFTYNALGALSGRENPDGTTESFQDVSTLPLISSDLVLVENILNVVEDEDGEATTHVLGPLGLPIKSIDAIGNETTYVRDANGRVTYQTDPDPDGPGGQPAPMTAFVYDAAGNLIQKTLPDSTVLTWDYDPTWNVPISYTDERGLLTVYDVNFTTGLVDSERRVIGEIDDLINLETDDIVTEYTYTPAPSGPTDPPAGLMETTTDPLGRVTVYTYNARGDVTSVTYADGTADEATTYTYYNADGTVDYELDELSRRTDYDYDLLGRLILKTLPDPDGGDPLPRPEIEYEYDEWNRLVKEIDPLERETIYTYDNRGRQTKVERPDHDGDKSLTTTTTKYNDRGLVESITDPLGRETTYTYDKLGRQTKVTLPAVADPTTAVSEVQIIDFDSGTEGTFKLNGNSKDGVIDLADLSDLQSILDAIWGAGNTSATYTSTEATITFKGDLSGTNIAQMTITDITGTKGATPFVSTDTGGVAASMVNPTTETEYDPLGRVLWTKDALSKITTYDYTNNGQNLKITLPDPDDAGPLDAPYMYQVFDESGSLVSETDANGNETTRTYDILGRLTKVTQPYSIGGSTEYVYDAVGNLRYVSDALGNWTEYQYDNRNRQVKVISPDPDGVGGLSALTTETVYDDAGQVSKVTAPGSRVTEYYYDGLGRLTLTKLPDPDGPGGVDRPEIESSYDAAGRKETDTDALDNVTTYEYDLLDNLIKVTQPDPDAGGVLAAPVSESTYDAAGQLESSTDALGNVTTYFYDNLGRTTKVVAPDPDAGGALVAPVTKYEYSITGNLLKVMDALKLETTYEYDYLNRKTISRDALGGETAFEYDAVGNLKKLTDPVGNETVWYYDAMNRVTEETNQLYDTRYFVYDVAGNLRQKTDRNERVTVYEYDNLNRQIAEEWWTGYQPTVNFSNNADGYRVNEEQYVGFYDYMANFASGTFTLTFDSQTTSAIAWNADAATVQAALEALGNVGVGDVLVTKYRDDAYHQEWNFKFRGALVGVDVAQITVDPSLVYNGIGPPTYENESTAVGGLTVNEEQVITPYNATGGTFTLSFGAQRTAPIAWNASTSAVDSALEALSGVGTISVSGSAGGPYTITFTGAYAGQDIAPLQRFANGLTNSDLLRAFTYTFNNDGDMAEVSDPDATYEFTYDGLGRVTNYVQNITGLNPEIEFVSEYNAAGRRELLQAILGGDEDFRNTYAYDDMLRLSTMIQQSGSDNVVAPKRFEFSYNELSQYTRIDRYASTNQSEFVASSHYKYDDLNRLLKLVHSETTTAPTSGWGTDPLAGYEFAYDAASRILSIDSLLDGLSNYAHDDTNQLLDADHATMTDEAYEYDANGNRIMSGYDVDPNNQLYSDGTYNYTYDDEGNRVSRTKISNGYVTRYEWDFRNRLTKVIEEDNATTVLQVTENFYDAGNQWIRRRFDDDGAGGNPFVDTFFVYESGQVVLEFAGDDDTDLSHRYLWSEIIIDQSLADETVTSLGSAGAVLWTFGDHLGTIRDLVTYNSTTDIATVANHREWDSYGNLLSQFNATYASTIGYTGRMWDITTGLQNNLNRWFDPAVGRWISEDPIGFLAGDANTVRYVGNSPMAHADPNGLWKIERNGQSRALAIATNQNDTIDRLAAQIRLDSSEYEHWLKAEDGNPLPLTSAETNLYCRQFSVPNTVIAYKSGGLIGLIALRFNNRVDSLARVDQALGYKVIRNTDTEASTLNNMWKDTDKYKFYFSGHGSTSGLHVNGVFVSDSVSPLPVRYNLAAIHLYSCYSADGHHNGGLSGTARDFSYWKSRVSTDGTFVGFSGLAFHWSDGISVSGGVEITEEQHWSAWQANFGHLLFQIHAQELSNNFNPNQPWWAD